MKNFIVTLVFSLFTLSASSQFFIGEKVLVATEEASKKGYEITYHFTKENPFAIAENEDITCYYFFTEKDEIIYEIYIKCGTMQTYAVFQIIFNRDYKSIEPGLWYYKDSNGKPTQISTLKMGENLYYVINYK